MKTLFVCTSIAGCVGLLLVVLAPLVRGWSPTASRTRAWLRGMGMVLLFLVSLAACVVAAGGLGFFAWPVVAALWIRGAMHFRAVQRENLFSALTLAVNKQLPLAPLATAFATEQDGGFARRARRLAQGLSAGWSLTYAVDNSPRTFPRDAALAVHIGEKTGNLSGALAALQPSSGFDRTMARPFFVRLLALCPLGLILVLFFSVKVAPSMQKIMSDFGIPMFAEPGDTTFSAGIFQEIVGEAWHWFISPRWLIWAILFSLVGFPLAILKIWLEWRGTQIPRLPVLKPIINGMDMGPVLRLLGEVAKASRPLPEGFRQVAGYHPKLSVRNRFERVLIDISGGMSWPRSFARHQLVTPTDAAILDAAQRSGNLAWALREVADGGERRAGYRLQGLTQVALPLLVLPAVLVTALLAAACFTMMVQLIWGLTL